MNIYNFDLVPNDIEKIQKFKTLFRVILKSFYDHLDQVLLETILHMYFQKFFFETEQLKEMTKIPDKYIRQSLFRLEKDKIIKPIRLLNIDNQLVKVREYIKTQYSDQKIKEIEFYELNSSIYKVFKNKLD